MGEGGLHRSPTQRPPQGWGRSCTQLWVLGPGAGPGLRWHLSVSCAPEQCEEGGGMGEELGRGGVVWWSSSICLAPEEAGRPACRHGAGCGQALRTGRRACTKACDRGSAALRILDWSKGVGS